MNTNHLFKSLLASTVASVFSMSANAQSNVSVYGVLDAGLVAESGNVAGSVTKLTSGVSAGSRLGFKGTEDLGSGMSAMFVMEGGVSIDSGMSGQGGLLFGRQVFVGLNGNLGTLKLGRQYTPVDSVVGTVDPFGNGYAGRGQNVFANAYVSRVNNMVVYNSPVVNGFSAELAHGFGEVADDLAKNRYMGASAGYAEGPLYVRLTTQKTENATATGSIKNTVLAATYNFGPVKAHLAFASNKGDLANVSTLDARDVLIGASIPVGAGNIMLSYVHRDDNMPSDRNASQIGVGYQYFLSKRTFLYTAYGRINNQNGATYTVGNGSEPGSGNKAFNLGIRSNF
jgi:predicted porin